MADLRRAVLRIRTLRLASLVGFFALFNSALFGFQPLPLLLPILQSSGNPQTTVGDAFAALQYMLWEPTFPWLPIASFLLSAALLGRALCGWACPFGLIQDILGYIKRRHFEFSPRTHKNLVYVKYGLLGIVLLIGVTMAALTTTNFGSRYRSALGVFAQAPFNALSPHDTLFAILPVMTYGAISAEAPFADLAQVIATLQPLFWVRLVILVAVLAFAIYLPRSWCRYFCPAGAGLALASRYSLLGLKRDLVHCTREGCKQCVDVCPMKVPILELPWEKFTSPECTYCLECVDECGTRALKLKFL